jgi:hypothetical protein
MKQKTKQKVKKKSLEFDILGSYDFLDDALFGTMILIFSGFIQRMKVFNYAMKCFGLVLLTAGVIFSFVMALGISILLLPFAVVGYIFENTIEK